MGYTRSSATDWDTYSSTHTTGKGYDALYTNRAGVAGAAVKSEYDPLNIKVRESRDSDANPNSTPIAIFLDGTGSMGAVLTAAVQRMGDLFKEIYDKKPVTDPHILTGIFQDVAVGDYKPLQFTQFESDTVIVDQLRDIYIRSGGGGNDSESYHLPLYAMATRADCDAFKKGRKGYLFTIGDEEVPGDLTPEQIREVFGPDEGIDTPLSYEGLLRLCEDNWEVFHIIVEQGSHMRYNAARVKESWQRVLGERAILLDDIERLPEVITGVLSVMAGKDAAAVASAYSGSTAVTVAKAVSALAKSGSSTAAAAVTRF